jgi:hypothetical protein
MNNQADNDENVLSRLIREAGDPQVSPDSKYAGKLRIMILDHVDPMQSIDRVKKTKQEAKVVSYFTLKGVGKMKHITKLAVAASILAAVGFLVFWMSLGSSTNIAFADVAKALEGVRSATYDETCSISVTTSSQGRATTTKRTTKNKVYFLASSRTRTEGHAQVGGEANGLDTIIITDEAAWKCLILFPSWKSASALDMKELTNRDKPANGPQPTIFEIVRQIVREANGGKGGHVEALGTKEIDGHPAVGFKRSRSGKVLEMIFWADPETARPLRVEYPNHVMDHFRYDVDLDPALFSIDPPAEYIKAAEDHIVNFLRFCAKHHNGIFPPKILEDQECGQAFQSSLRRVMANLPEAQAFSKKHHLWYGEVRPEFMKEWRETIEPIQGEIIQKHGRDMAELQETLKPETDAHYRGGGVKLDTPDRPILWYRPRGCEKYHVIYADLSVKEKTPEEVTEFPKPESNLAEPYDLIGEKGPMPAPPNAAPASAPPAPRRGG